MDGSLLIGPHAVTEPPAESAPDALPPAVAAPPEAPSDQPPPPPSAARTDRWAHRRGEPRTFAAAWIAYLFVAAIIALGTSGSLGLVATDAYRASAQVLMVLAGIGVGALWPMLRLSQERPDSPAKAAMRDFLIVMLSLQAIIWPQSLPWMASWPVEVTGALSAHFAAWGLVVSGVLALAWAPPITSAIRRGTFMAVLLAVGVVMPLARVLTGPTEDLSRRAPSPDILLTASPFAGAWEIPADRAWSGLAGQVSQAQWMAFGAVAALGLACVAFAAIRGHKINPR